VAPVPEPRRFPSPFEVEIPPACEGWQEMYAYHMLFGEERRAFDEGRFWFQDALHSPEPFCPFDAVWFHDAITALNQMNARVFVMPPSLGTEYRVLNGYVYISANDVTDSDELTKRGVLFARRGGHYYRRWDELFKRWVEKVEDATLEL
jgi:pyruvate,water dikinase